ncbi:condensation domain-containing protein [Streptomyces sp. NPDC021020]|uniref:condensation domain-containing protein n=1 Tax=Streptomyces sp. NPDC021020 TaxID=3365109 RepID=UPI00379AAF2B
MSEPPDGRTADLERTRAEIAALKRQLAEKRAERERRTQSRRIVRVPREGAMVCTHQQESAWFSYRLDPSSSSGHIPFVLRLRGDLDVPALERSLHALVVRHEALRTRFVEHDGRPRQIVDPPPDTTRLPVIDLPTADTDQAHADQWAAHHIHRPLNLATGPVFRAALARTAADEHILALVVHHIVADGWSVRILAGELSQLYLAYTSGAEPRLPDLLVQPADHAAWQRGRLDGPELERQLDHWRDRLANLPTVDLPADRPRPAQPTGAGADVHRQLPAGLVADARAHVRAHRGSFLALMQAALLVVLHRYTGETDLPLGSIFSGRDRAEIEPVVGSFVNAAVLRTDLGGRPTFAELVDRCHATVLDAASRQDVPFGLVVDALKPERVAGRNPLFQICLTLQATGTAIDGPALGDVSAEPLAAVGSEARFDLGVVVTESTDGTVDVAVEYATELFDADRVERFLDHFVHALARGLAAPGEVATDIEVMSADERSRVLHGTGGYVLDALLRPVPVGVPGELFLAGDGLADGCHGRPGLTARRFLADPHADRPGRRLHATGDLARWRPDGTVEHLGRIDRQFKLLGERVDPGAIERALCRNPDVRACAVVLRDGRLVAYVVGDADPAAVKTGLADVLPARLIPTGWVAVPELPVTAEGEPDTDRLPDPPAPAVAYVAPRTDTERRLAATWQELLNVERVGVGDDFFRLGANSLQGIQLAVRILADFAVDLDPRELFSISGLEQLAALVDGTDTVAAVEPIVPVPRDTPVVCTYQQEGLWFEHKADPDSVVYHIGFGIRLRGDLDVPALERSLHALVVRHEALRTRFVEHDGRPRQIVDPPPDTTRLPVIDLPAADTDQADAGQWAAHHIRQPLDLATGPVFRAALARTAADEHILALVVHHIVADGWSGAVLAGELSTLYAAAADGVGAAGIHAVLPPLAVQPADHAVWQREQLAGENLERHLGYWRDRLANLPTVDFPTDRPRPARPTGAGTTLGRHLPDALTADARAYALDNHVSFLAVLHAALLTVLNRYTGQDDLAIGSVFSGRTRRDLEPLVGYFVNAVVLRTDAGDGTSFAELVRRCHGAVMDAGTHQDVPFSLVVDALKPDRGAGRNPLFGIALSLQPSRGAGEELRLGSVIAEPVDIDSGFARFDIDVNVDDTADGRLYVSVEFSTELFDTDRIERLVDHFTAALAGGLSAPQTAAADIEIMSPAERDQVLHAWNPTPSRPAALPERAV